MDTSFLENLKEWREERKISQKKLSDMAGISLTTLRLFEIGKQKPQERTLSRLVNVVRHINEGTAPPSAEEILAPRRRGPGKRKAKALEAAAVSEPPLTPKIAPAVEAAPTPIPAPVAVEPKPAAPAAPPVAAPVPAPMVAPVSSPIRLSNLDLELIGRILNMSDKEKVNLLVTLIK